MTATVPPAIRSGPVDAGRQLNRVKHTACPLCYRKGPMTVHQRVVVWACGHWREIPPFGAGPPRRRRDGRFA